MSNVALYTFGLLNPTTSIENLREFSALGIAIYDSAESVPGFLGQAETATGGDSTHVPGADFGPWGAYALPTDLPDFAGHDPNVHIATLSLWRDVGSARDFVYRGMHKTALKRRYDWFLKGPWPGQVLWPTDESVTPQWSDGTSRLVALAREGDTQDHFTFTSRWGRA